MPSIVEDSLLERAIGRLQATYTLGNSFVGPPLGGVLFGLAVAAPLAFGAAGYAAAFILLLMLPSLRSRGDGAVGNQERSVRTATVEGWRIFHTSRSLVALCALAGVGNAVSAASYGLVPLVLVERLAAPANLMGLDGFLVMTQSVVLVSARARLIPDAAMGRVTALFRSFSLGAGVVGGLIGGALAKFTSISAVYLVGGVLLVVLSVALAKPLSTSRLRAEIGDASQKQRSE